MSPSALPLAAADLRTLVRGSVTSDRVKREGHSWDYGRLSQRVPNLVVRPVDAADIAAVVRYARDHQLTVTTQAAAHSQGGQSLTETGILLDMYDFGAIEEIDATNPSVRVGSGRLWRDLVRATMRQGLVPPVLTDNLFTTVGGTASVGGVGCSSFRYGVQLDNHMALEIVTGTGDVLSCSDTENRELFLHALGGLGQFGVITHLVHRLRQHGRAVRRSMLLYSDPEGLITDVRRLLDGTDVHYLRCGAVFLRGAPSYVLGVDTETNSNGAPTQDALLRAIEHGKRVTLSEVLPFHGFVFGDQGGDRPRAQRDLGIVAPGLDIIVPFDAAPTYLREVFARIPPDIRASTTFLLLFLQRETLTRPMFMTPDAPSLLLFTIEPVLPRARASELLDLLDELAARGRELGGVRYLPGSVLYEAADWRQHYGARWTDILRLKRMYDPHRVFSSGPCSF